MIKHVASKYSFDELMTLIGCNKLPYIQPPLHRNCKCLIVKIKKSNQ